MRGFVGWVLFFGLAYAVFFGTGTFRVPDALEQFAATTWHWISQQIRH